MSTSLNLVGKWRNELGSILEIVSSEGGILDGFYQSAVGEVDPECRYRLIGMQTNQLVTFCVAWDDQRCVTSWVGRFTVQEGRDVLYTVWHLARMYRDRELTEEAPLWAAFLTNSDQFYRFSAESSPVPKS